MTSLRYENPSGHTDDFVYFDQHQPVTLTQPGLIDQTDTYNNTTEYTIDTTDRVTKTRDPLGNTRTTTFNPNNDVTAAVSPNNFSGGSSDPSTTASYNSDNTVKNVTFAQTGSLNEAELQFPAYGSSSDTSFLPTQTTDDRQNETDINYNKGGVTSIGGGVVSGTAAATSHALYEGQTDSGTTYHCGPSSGAAFPGALCETQDPMHSSGENGHRTQYRYDAMGELTSIIPPTPGHGRTTPATTTLGYDAYSRQTSLSDGKSQDSTYTYDNLDRLTKITYDDGSSTTYTYDEDGDRTAAIDKNPSGTVTHQDTYTFDTQDRLSTETNGSNGTVTLTYDANSNVLTYDDDGGTITYGYDAAGGLTSLAEPGGDCDGYSPSNPPTEASLCTIFTLDKNGNREVTTYPGNNAQQTATLDATGRLGELSAAVTGSTLYDWAYNYVGTGTQDSLHLAKITNNTDGSFRQYAYDGLNRLTTAREINSGGSTLSRNVYCYDKAGNRTSSLTGVSAACPATQDITYDGANQALDDTSGTTYTYDLDGNLTNITPGGTGAGTTYTYNDRNQQTAVTTSAGTNTLTYAGTGNTELLSTTTGGTTTSLLNTPLGISAVTTGGNTTYITRDPYGTLIGYRTGAGSGTGVNHRYYFTDERGSITTTVTPDGTIAASTRYDPYGQLTTGTAGLFGYTGSYTGTGDTNTTKLGARYYNPTTATFTQTDPNTSLAHPGQDNPYTYAGADPVNNADPSGLCSWYDVECDAESAVNTTINYTDNALNDVSDTVDNYVSDTASEYIEQGYDAVSGCLAGAVAAEESGATALATAFFGPAGTAGATIGGCALGAGLTEEGGEL